MEFCWQPISALPKEWDMGPERVLFYDPDLEIFHVMRAMGRGRRWVRSFDHKEIERYDTCVWTPLEHPAVEE